MTHRIAITGLVTDHAVRVEIIDGESWFCAYDVGKALGMTASEIRTAIYKLDASDQSVHSMDTLSGRQNLDFLNESGLYDVVLDRKLDYDWLIDLMIATEARIVEGEH